jgi:hypothetical protein
MTKLPRSLARIALFQDDVLTFAQLLDGGVTGGFIKSQVNLGRWQRLYRGVYATFSGQPTRQAQLSAAVLAAGPGAMLSHESAAETWGLTDKPARLIHVTIPGARRVAPIAGVRVHLSARAEVAVHPARMPPRTLIEETVLDLVATSAVLDDAVGWVTRALGRKLTTQAQLRETMAARPRMRWRAVLTELLEPDAAGTHSTLEYRYDRDVERPHGLPAGTRQAKFRHNGRNAYRDRIYEEYLVVVELDGRATHTIDKRWDDIHRDNATSASGMLTLRYGWLDVTTRPCQVAAEVASALANRGFIGAHGCSPGCPVGQVTSRYRPSA